MSLAPFDQESTRRQRADRWRVGSIILFLVAALTAAAVLFIPQLLVTAPSPPPPPLQLALAVRCHVSYAAGLIADSASFRREVVDVFSAAVANASSWRNVSISIALSRIEAPALGAQASASGGSYITLLVSTNATSPESCLAALASIAWPPACASAGVSLVQLPVSPVWPSASPSAPPSATPSPSPSSSAASWFRWSCAGCAAAE